MSDLDRPPKNKLRKVIFKPFTGLTKEEKSKIHFIHFNHTNPILNPQSPQSKEVISKGFKIARINDIFKL